MGPAGRSFYYLHGFASSARSTKASYFGERFREHGLALTCPDFNLPDFSTLTLTRMLHQLADEIAAGGAATLIGSSLGGTLAVLAAASFGARIERLVLLAPAVMFARAGHHLLPPDRIDEWRRLGSMPFFHYGDNAERMLNFTFYEDSFRYNPFDALFEQPTLIFQGLRDGSVDPRTVEAFARTRPNVTLSLLDDDHQLTASLPRIWDGVAAFLGIM
ncbi:MAG TPA: YqiA/YcfP family alpha/beta fold hydrolase [Vicinamibacterales bacterium]|jgi:pimeloyl-ACP methyl ester carboxylesterase|nr:YqiA/YcfP family alpha/beta fold hydrolase [Vicinamibacterales bacterium]